MRPRRIVDERPDLRFAKFGQEWLGSFAHYLATDTYPLKSGDTCIVLAGAGGVGLLLTQIAKLKGAHVIACVSTPEKAALSREAGADEVVQKRARTSRHLRKRRPPARAFKSYTTR